MHPSTQAAGSNRYGNRPDRSPDIDEIERARNHGIELLQSDCNGTPRHLADIRLAYIRNHSNCRAATVSFV